MWNPWEKSTGPRTPEGKSRSSLNVYKGSVRPLLRNLARVMREQETQLDELGEPISGLTSVADGEERRAEGERRLRIPTNSACGSAYRAIRRHDWRIRATALTGAPCMFLRMQFS